MIGFDGLEHHVSAPAFAVRISAQPVSVAHGEDGGNAALSVLAREDAAVRQISRWRGSYASLSRFPEVFKGFLRQIGLEVDDFTTPHRHAQPKSAFVRRTHGRLALASQLVRWNIFQVRKTLLVSPLLPICPVEACGQMA